MGHVAFHVLHKDPEGQLSALVKEEKKKQQQTFHPLIWLLKTGLVKTKQKKGGENIDFQQEVDFDAMSV